MIDWDAYRAAYPAMSYADLQAFHSRVWAQYPNQDHHSPSLLMRFFDGIEGRVSVVEVGGWRGKAAAEILLDHPEIRGWLNFELCAEAADAPVTDDPRYAALSSGWAWEHPVRADVAVLAHVLEHMQTRQVEELIAWLAAGRVRHVYVEAPLLSRPRAWTHSTSAHVLEIGWDGVLERFAAAGYTVGERHSYPPDRVVYFLVRA